MTEFLQQPYFCNLMVVCAHISISFTICLILLVYRFNKTVGDRRFRILIGYCSMAYGISFIHNTIIFICMLYDVDKIIYNKNPLLLIYKFHNESIYSFE